MRWSKAFIPTLRDDPAEAESVSHRLMLRAGLIRKLISGVYSYLPLGFRVLNKVIHIIREEMDRTGAQEILMPVLQPPELWEETDRLDAFGPLMCKFLDRTERWNILGPTHEEVVTHIVRNEITSYRQLPITLYQIQNKFRDEIRPRFGVIRTKEFLMKDAYSFDLDVDGMARSYQLMYDTYSRIFRRCGLKFIPVEADTGLMGGDVSHEFIVPCPSGEDEVARCARCGYAANRLMAQAGAPTERPERFEPLKEVHTPGKSSAEAVAKFLGVPVPMLVKTLIYTIGGQPVALLVRGDHEVNPSKLAKIFRTSNIAMADTDTIEEVTGGPMGFSGPVGLKIKVFTDLAIKNLSDFVTGANRMDYHLINVNWGRDFNPGHFIDLHTVVEGDPCPRCGSAMSISHGIEVGQVFKLGTKYSEKMGALFQDEQGRTRPAQMGCYGIGVNRIVASAIEVSHDQRGIIWPKQIAPYQIIITSINPKDPKVWEASERIYNSLLSTGMEVLWDDRDLTAGVKFMDADLIGIPVRVTVGTKTVESGSIDIKPRNKSEMVTVPLERALGQIKDVWDAYEI